MRIIGGEFRGFRLEAPRGLEVRPTSDRVRESIFNMLGGSARGARVLDLFAGTGALGLEALSRSASSCCFVDSSPAACSAIRHNIEKLGVQCRSRVLRRDVNQLLRESGRDGLDSRSLVFLDPPYDLGFPHETVRLLVTGSGLAPGALLVVESDARGAPDLDEGDWLRPEVRVLRARRYGDTAVTIMRYAEGGKCAHE